MGCITKHCRGFQSQSLTKNYYQHCWSLFVNNLKLVLWIVAGGRVGPEYGLILWMGGGAEYGLIFKRTQQSLWSPRVHSEKCLHVFGGVIVNLGSVVWTILR